ncbi:MAG: glycosyltransferase family 9 protein [Cyclobacteriaceae bacterium]|nr:glycosyltransferase family 9 protein [Cyclobacteriaceae bacterium]
MQKEVKKILIIRFSSIGDIAWTTPVVRCIKKQLDGVELHYCTKIQYKSMLEANPYIDKLHYLESNLSTLIHELKKEKFDFILDLHRNIRTSILKFRLGSPSKAYNKLRIKRLLYTNFQINFMPNCHVVDRYFDAASPLGIKNDDMGLDYFIPHKDEVELDWLPKTHQKGYVVYVIGATGWTKILPFNKMVELCDRINKPIILVGGKEDFEAGDKLENFFNVIPENQEMEEGLKKLGKKTIIFNACGKFNLSQSASLVKQADVVFGHDTGLTHIAAAFKKSVFSIWGGTVPNNFYPYGTKFYLIENTKLNCRPCSKSGRSSCPKGHFKCMNDLVFDFNPNSL